MLLHSRSSYALCTCIGPDKLPLSFRDAVQLLMFHCIHVYYTTCNNSLVCKRMHGEYCIFEFKRNLLIIRKSYNISNIIIYIYIYIYIYTIIPMYLLQ